MLILLLAIHILVAVSLVGVVLLQKSEGGALGIGGGGMSNFMTGRGTANVLTRATAILAACFMLTSLLLVVLPQLGGHRPSILPQNLPMQQAPVAPSGSGSTGQAPATPTAPKPTTPAAPAAPLGQ